MAGSVNKVILIGHLGADPELRYTSQSKPVCNMRIATTETWKDRSGAKQEKTEWHRIVAFGDTAENCAKYLEKGRPVYIEGRLQTTSYEKDGIKRYSTDIVADRVVFLGGGNGNGERRGGGSSRGRSERDEERPPDRESGGPPPADEDIPF